MASSYSSDQLFEYVALWRGFLVAEQLTALERERATAWPELSLGALAVQQALLSAADANVIERWYPLAELRLDGSAIGALAVERGLIGAEQLQELFGFQEKQFVATGTLYPLVTLLLESELIAADQLADLLPPAPEAASGEAGGGSEATGDAHAEHGSQILDELEPVAREDLSALFRSEELALHTSDSTATADGAESSVPIVPSGALARAVDQDAEDLAASDDVLGSVPDGVPDGVPADSGASSREPAIPDDVLRAPGMDPDLTATADTVAGPLPASPPGTLSEVLALAEPDVPGDGSPEPGAGDDDPEKTVTAPTPPQARPAPSEPERTDANITQALAALEHRKRAALAGPDEGVSFGSRYALLDRLGKGRAGVVYRARQLSLDRLVALRVLPPAAETDPERLGRFLTDAQKAGRLTHPNLLQVFEVDQAEGRYYIATELVRGESLMQRLGRERRLSARVAAEWLKSVAKALQAAHAKDLVHAKLTLDKIWVTAEGMLKVLGLGTTGVLVATGAKTPSVALDAPHYCAPEVAQGFAPDERSDLYTFGIGYFALLTGQFPFFGETTAAILKKHSSEPVRPPSVFNPNIDATTDAIVMQLLAKNPAERHAGFREVAHALDQELERLGAPVGGASGTAAARCPQCQVVVSTGAAICAHCGYRLPPPPGVPTALPPPMIAPANPPTRTPRARTRRLGGRRRRR